MRMFKGIHLFFCLTFFVSASSAQTIVCSGDSVVVILTGYKHGTTLWQQSSDRTIWSYAQGTSYNDSLIIITTNAYYYRAIVADGSCSPFYSDTVLISIHPTPPVAKAASGINQYGFIANWSAVDGATDYYLDVATDAAFTSFVTGDKNIDVSSSDSTYSIANLYYSTTYYYRVRAFDSHCGKTGATSANSKTITVTTDTLHLPFYCTYKSTCTGNITDNRDNQIYKTVQIGSQCWMAQNLNVGNWLNAMVPQTNNNTIEKYCYGSNCKTYGGLYTWDEMMAYGQSDSDALGPQGICSAGWHLPTDNEWKCLEMTLGMDKTNADLPSYRGTNEGGKLKDTSTLWQPPNKAATNESGFTALPGGIWDLIHSFNDQGLGGYWWTATEADSSNVWGRYMLYHFSEVYRPTWAKANHGNSVRCVKD